MFVFVSKINLLYDLVSTYSREMFYSRIINMFLEKKYKTRFLPILQIIIGVNDFENISVKNKSVDSFRSWIQILREKTQ